MKLALAMGRTLRELESALGADEFGMWAALYAEDPWDATRQDLNAGVICSTIANYAGKKRKNSAKPAVPADFMPYLKKPETVADAISPEDYFAQLGIKANA